MDLNLLQWKNNSCYMDTILTCLFLSDKNKIFLNEFFNKDFDKDTRQNIGCKDFKKSIIIRKLIQIEAYKIYSSFNKIDTNIINNVSDFRKSFKHCEYYENYSDHGMHDSAEFLSYIIELFGIFSHKSHKVYGIDNTNKKLTLLDKNINMYSTPIIPHFLKGTIKLSSLLKTVEQNDVEIVRDNITYSGIITELTLIDSNYLIFNIQRSINQGTLNITPIILEKTIPFNNKEFHLVAVILFKNNHYTSYFRNNDIWYFYDDTLPSLIQKFDINEISKRGVLYIYFY